MRSHVGHAVGLPSGLDRIEGLPDRAIAQRMEVHLEAELVELRHVTLEAPGIHEIDAPVARRMPAGIEVRLEHRGGVVLGNAVGHDLDGRRRETADQ